MAWACFDALWWLSGTFHNFILKSALCKSDMIRKPHLSNMHASFLATSFAYKAPDTPWAQNPSGPTAYGTYSSRSEPKLLYSQLRKWGRWGAQTGSIPFEFDSTAGTMMWTTKEPWDACSSLFILLPCVHQTLPTLKKGARRSRAG